MQRIFISLLITASAFAQQSAKKPLTVESLYGVQSVTGRGPESLKWSPNGETVTYIQRDPQTQRPELWKIDVKTGQKSVMVSSEKLGTLVPTAGSIRDPREQERRTRYNVAAYQWAPDSKHLLFDANGAIWYFRLDFGTAVNISKTADSVRDPKFSPNGKLLSYIRKHNIYSLDIADFGIETQLTRIDPPKGSHSDEPTRKEDEDNILNGDTDWVYPEELGVRSNYFWSPDSKQIAYLQTDQTNVPTYPIVDWIPTHPTVENYHYPKAGDVNPSVRLGVVGTGGGNTKWINFGDALKDAYLPRFGWIKPGWIWAQVLNRAQNKLDLYFIDVQNNRSRIVLSETSDTFLELNDDFRIFADRSQFLWASWHDGHTHLYLYSFDYSYPMSSGAKLVRQLTHGDFEVQGVAGVEENGGNVYYLSNEGDAREEHLHSVNLNGSGMQKLDSTPGVHGANFNPSASYYIHNWSSAVSTPVWELCQPGGKCGKEFTSNDVPGTFDLAETRWIDFKADDDTVLNGMMYIPPGFDKAAQNSVPVLLDPYGGPHGQRVRNQWSEANLFNMLLAKRGMAVLIVDNRGSGNRGKKFSEVVWKDLGRTELKDQLASLDQALAAFPQLDGKRLGIWGWSYGGYMTSYSMTHSDRFSCGMAGAPVTDWHNYDSIYTERYMGLPTENDKGYKESSAVLAAKDLHGKLLIAHGTSDDNVHTQNDIQFIEELIQAGKQYDYIVYPRKTHGVTGTADRMHLWDRVEAHFEGCLLGK